MLRKFDDAKKPKILTDGQPKHKYVMGADGVRVEIKQNPNQLTRKMVHPDGSTYDLSLATGWQIDHLESVENRYGKPKLYEKLRKGHLPFNECPLATGRVPPANKNDKACEGRFTNEHCCPHIDRIREARTAAHTAKERQFASSMETGQERMVRALLQQAQDAAKAPPEAGPEGHVKLR